MGPAARLPVEDGALRRVQRCGTALWHFLFAHPHLLQLLACFLLPDEGPRFRRFFCFATFLFAFHRRSAIRPRAVRARRCAILESAEPAEIRAISPRCVKTAEVRLIWQRCREPWGDPSEAGGIPEETDALREAEGPLTRARAVALALAGGGESLSERPPKKRLRPMKVAKK